MASKVGQIIQTAIVSAFTLVTAFIWRDAIIEAIDVFFPTQELFYKFLAAIITTILALIAIYIFLQTEHEAEVVFHKLRRNKGIKPYKRSILSKVEDAIEDK